MFFSKNFLLKFLITFVIISIEFSLLSCKKTNELNGTITIELVDLDNEIIKSKNIDFSKDDKLSDLVINNFNNVLIKNGMILEIEDYKTPSDWSTFLSLYTDYKMSNYGIEDISLSDNLVVSIRITKYIN